jgi:hypothetical protein
MFLECIEVQVTLNAADWLVGGMIGWLVGWLIGWLLHLLAYLFD